MSRESIPWAALLTFLALSFVGGGSALALDPRKSVGQYLMDAWQTKNGLPRDTVRRITQTRDGYLWLATQAGLVRFDGANFTTFNETSTRGLVAGPVLSLITGADGSLWIGTYNGLVRMKDGAFTGYTIKDGLPDKVVDSLSEDDHGGLWIVTRDGNLTRFENDVFTKVTGVDGRAPVGVGVTRRSKGGGMWVGTVGGKLLLYRDGKFTPKNSFPYRVSAIYEAEDGRLWVGTLGSGLYQIKDRASSRYTVREGLSDNSVRTIVEDKDKNLWVGTDGGGLNLFRGGRFTAFTSKEGLPSDNVKAIFEDREGNLWVGLQTGLVKLADAKFTTYSTTEGLPHDLVWSVCGDPERGMWFGTQSGLSLLKDEEFTTYKMAGGLNQNSIRVVYEDRDNNLWVGSQDGRLHTLKNGKFVGLAGLNNSSIIHVIYQDRDRRMWVGTDAGLISFTGGGNFKTYTTKDGLSGNQIRAVVETRDGDLWIGTANGLSRFEDGRFTVLRAEDGLTGNHVTALYGDAQGHLWATTRRGLNRIKDGRVTAYAKNEESVGSLSQILEDDGGNLWLGSDEGIHRIGKTQFDELNNGKIKALSFVSYDTADGMKSRECNGNSQPSAWRTRDGKLWFATAKGGTLINPNEVMTNGHPPSASIQQVLVDKEIQTREGVSLPPGSDYFEFHYAGLSFVAPEKVSFKYKLEGFDEDWIDAGTRREAYYTRIPPGRYQFKVMARNNDGVWSTTDDAFDFELRPHFYQTPWFYLSCAALLCLAALALHRLRLKRARAQFSMVLADRNRIALELHDTLSQCFTAVALQLDAVAMRLPENLPATKNHLDLAREMIRHSRTEASRSVWDLRAQSLESSDLMTALQDVIRQLIRGTNVKVHLRVGGDPRALPDAVEASFLRIGQESVTNAVKHARADSIHVNLDYEPTAVSLRVKDDGVGFDADTLSISGEGGLGLTGMRERAKKINGRLTIKSVIGVGTEIEVSAETA